MCQESNPVEPCSPVGGVTRCHLPTTAVWYPTPWSSFGKVVCVGSNRLLVLLKKPLAWLYLPVRTVARLGPQIELGTTQRSNRTPSRAIRSMFGVARSCLGSL